MLYCSDHAFASPPLLLLLARWHPFSIATLTTVELHLHFGAALANRGADWGTASHAP